MQKIQYAVALDALTVKFKTDYFLSGIYKNKRFPNDIEIAPHQGGNYNFSYEHTFDFIYFGCIVGQIHVLPRKELFLSPDTVSVEFENWFLYDRDLEHAYWSLLECKELGLQYQNITKMDIAVDTTENLMERFDWFEKRPRTYTRNKRIKALWSEYIEGVLLKPFGLYNKSAEIAKTGKQYITRFHNNNFASTAPKYRLELRLNAKSIRNRGVQIDHTKICESEYLLQIFQEFSRDLYWTKEATKRSGEKYYLLAQDSDIPAVGKTKKVKNANTEALKPRQVMRWAEMLLFAGTTLELGYSLDKLNSALNRLISVYEPKGWAMKELNLCEKHLSFIQSVLEKIVVEE